MNMCVEHCYWQGKTEVLGERLVSVPLCPPEFPHGFKTKLSLGCLKDIVRTVQ